MNKAKILVVIPARKGSKGIKSKNKKLLLGNPLVSYSLKTASMLPNNFISIVSTDDSEIINIADGYGIRNNGLRPDKLSNDSALTLDVLNHELLKTESTLNIKFDGVMLLQPTCPIRDLKHIKNIEKIFVEHNKLSSVVSIKKIDSEHPFRMKRLINKNILVNFIDQGFEDMRPRQELPPVFIRNGSIYLTPAEEVRVNNTLVTESTYGFEMDEKHSVNIDNIEDFLIAQYYMEAEAGIEPA